MKDFYLYQKLQLNFKCEQHISREQEAHSLFVLDPDLSFSRSSVDVLLKLSNVVSSSSKSWSLSSKSGKREDAEEELATGDENAENAFTTFEPLSVTVAVTFPLRP